MYSPTSFHRRRWRAKRRERNIFAAVLSIMVITLLATSLAQPRWFYFRGGSCTKKYLGVYEFFYVGYFDIHLFNNVKNSGQGGLLDNDDSVTEIVYHAYSDTLVNCVTPQIVNLFRFTITFAILGIITSLFAFFLDTLGVTKKYMRALKRNAVGNILTVIFCVVVIGLCYYISTLISHQQEMSKLNKGTRVEVKFDVSFYLVTAAGAVAVLASAANLLRRYPPEEDQDEALLEELDGLETFSVNYPGRSEITHVPSLTPPPPYSP